MAKAKFAVYHNGKKLPWPAFDSRKMAVDAILGLLLQSNMPVEMAIFKNFEIVAI